MSYTTWHNYGFGICVSDIVCDDVEKMEQLLLRAPKYRKSVHDYFHECGITNPTWEDYINFDQDYGLGLATILCEVIEEAENVRLVACDDFDCMDYLLFTPSYPWDTLTEPEQALTERSLTDLFGKYVRILTDAPVKVEYQSPENGG